MSWCAFFLLWILNVSVLHHLCLDSDTAAVNKSHCCHSDHSLRCEISLLPVLWINKVLLPWYVHLSSVVLSLRVASINWETCDHHFSEVSSHDVSNNLSFSLLGPHYLEFLFLDVDSLTSVSLPCSLFIDNYIYLSLNSVFWVIPLSPNLSDDFSFSFGFIFHLQELFVGICFLSVKYRVLRSPVHNSLVADSILHLLVISRSV